MEVENISEGLKMAVSKGESLQQAMQSFYNAGYKKENIESAARLLGTSNVMQPIKPKEIKIPQKQPLILKQPQFKPVQKVSSYGQLPQQQLPLPPKPVQKVSGYGVKQTNPKIIMVTLVIILLVVFGGSIWGILFFRETVIEFFNSLVG